MSGTNNISVHVVADTKQFNAAMTEAGARAEKFGQTVNQAGATQAAVAGERELAVQTQTTAQAWVQARMSMIAASERANAVLKAGRKANIASQEETLAELDARHDAFLAATRSYYGSLTQAQQAAYAEQEATANAQIEREYQSAAARLDAAVAVDTETAALEGNTAAGGANYMTTMGLTEAMAGLSRGSLAEASMGFARLGSRSSVLAGIMSPLGLTIMGSAAAIGALGFAAVEGARESAKFSDALLVTHDAAGLTSGQIEQMADALAGGSTTIGAAQEALLALAQSGKISGNAFKEAGQAVVDFSDLTGENTQQAAKYVEQLAGDTTQGLIKANEQYHFLDLAQMEHIQKLQQEGQTAEATQAIMDAFYTAMDSRERQATAGEGTLLHGIEAIKRGFSSFVHDLESIGAKVPIAQQVAVLEHELERMQAMHGEFGRLYNPTAAEASIEAQIAALKRLEAQEQMVAQAKAAANRTTDDAIAAAFGHHPKPHAPHKAASSDYGLSEERAALQQLSSMHQQAADKEIADDGRVLNTLQAVDDAKAESAQRVLQVRVQTAEQALNEAVRTGQMSAAQREAIEQRLTNTLYAEDLKRLQNELTTLTPETAAYQRVADQIEQIEAQHYQRMEALQIQYEATKQRQEQQALAARHREAMKVESIENQLMSGLISGRMTWAGMERRIFQEVAGAEVESVMHSVTETLMLHETAAAKTLAIKTASAMKTFAIDAAEAATGAFKAMVGVPYIGPILGAAAAAAALIEVKNLAHFDVGAWSIPHDMPAMVHRNEMIVPRPFADDFRSAVSGRGTAGGGGTAGDVHLHLHTADGDDAKRFLLGNADAVAAAVKEAHRRGAFA